MDELQQQSATYPMQSSDIAKRCAEVWYDYHVTLGNDGHLVGLVAWNVGSPIYSFRPLPEQIPAKFAVKMGDPHAREEIISGVHLRIQVYLLAKS